MALLALFLMAFGFLGGCALMEWAYTGVLSQLENEKNSMQAKLDYEL